MLRPIALALALTVAACDAGADLSPDFGDPYTVPPNTAVALADGQLTVTVQYAGGCAEHTFTARTRGPEAWVVHDANGDACEALVTEAVTVATDLGDGPATVLTPDGQRIRVGG